MEELLNRDQVVTNITSKHIVLLPSSGEEIVINKDNLNNIKDYKKVYKLVKHKLTKAANSEKDNVNNHIQKFGWIGYEPASDSGHLRYYPKGSLIFSLIKDWQEELLLNTLKAAEIKTPIMYDWSKNDIKSQAGTFYERLYYVSTHNKDKDYVLRFGGDLGLFSMLKDMKISYKNLPLRFYEFTNSFRNERRGELNGIKRARSFSFFDIHSICENLYSGWKEYSSFFKFQADYSKQLGIEFAIEFTVEEKFYKEYKKEIQELAIYIDSPILIEIISSKKHYWAIKHVFYDDNNYKFFNSQLDFDNSDIYGISHTSKEGQKHGCTICHHSLASIERWICIFLERAIKMEKPVMPIWLAPTQVRLIPLNNQMTQKTDEIFEILNASNIRVDIDDRFRKSIGSRIKMASEEWIPYTLVVGEKELETENYFFKCRHTDDKYMSIEQLINDVRKYTEKKPFRPIFNKFLSESPTI
ncbi:TPA: hypothetical protein QC448_004592 [Bacillus cereus]|uniref:His/Gly/Thr/Pro-type tRNA ligase C-terminal domain-containing protein n=1 Tax=Bacillus TaxID=1386 RepID=UPI000BF42AC0|nr:His/Gly/Thr/Pro-type tRNA ligase C-terminal domain-containing protein [Bacillus thuringiensis]PFU70396.1 hypothetical protein COK95_09880 [Bacillus thuringiensis]RAS90256.1 hypothetical protein A6E21_26115 [Bacillus cereus]HDR8129094.1 hypothetical protein [Bacillus cereus]HDR8493500.1 hypothetical protein [Bacillus cereus]